MVTLNDPITSQNIVDRFEELVTDIVIVISDMELILLGHSAFSKFGLWWSS